MGWKKAFGLTTALVLYCLAWSQSVPQKWKMRRHFIIAYDISPPFLHEFANTPEFRSAIIDLFKTAPKSQFDPALDDISFFHFGISKEEFPILRDPSVQLSDSEKIATFSRHLLKDQNLDWHEYTARHRSIDDYFSDAFNQPADPIHFGEGVSLSYYVYPLIMDRLSDEYAEDYIFIEISDFLTGSDFGNKNDFLRIKEIYAEQNTTAPTLIKAYSASLDAGYYRINYPEFTITASTGRIGALAYTVKPKIGDQHPESYSIFIDNNIQIRQKGFQSNQFSISPIQLKFTHSNRFVPNQLRLRVTQTKDDQPALLLDTIIAKTSDHLMEYDSLQHTYQIPECIVRLPLLTKTNNLTLEYIIEGQFFATRTNATGYYYTAARTVHEDQIHFVSSITRTMIYIAAIAIPLLILIYILYRLGRPNGLVLDIHGYIDSYESVDYSSHGKINLPYKYWDQAKNTLACNVRLQYPFPGYWFNWRLLIKLSIEPEMKPDGFDLYLKESADSTSEFYKGTILPIQPGNNDYFELHIRQNNQYRPILKPEPIKVSITARSVRSILLGLISFRQTTTRSYNCYIGPNLGDTWMGIDPGTTGSCIAAGNLSENILLGKIGESRSEIADSKIIFETNLDYTADPKQEKIPKVYYKAGTPAYAEFGTAAVTSFQSIKKLLGFKDRKKIRFRNGTDLELTGQRLSSLLIDSLYHDYKNFAEQAGARSKDFLQEGKFNPQRAVVAIPNNFTASKIKDLLECFSYLGQFEELRYIYEAEAVFFYYLYHYRQLNKDPEAIFSNETVLIFDMGGATINATIVSAIKPANEEKYKLDILAKLGYSIGGDTIDYCIIRSILDHSKVIAPLYVNYQLSDIRSVSKTDHKLYTDKVIALQKMAFQIKKNIIQNYGKKERLIEEFELINSMKDNLPRLEDFDVTSALIDTLSVSELYSQFVSDSKNKPAPILNNKYFQEFLYDNIKEVTEDIIGIAQGVAIDKVIFSGRSSSFPLIKDKVMQVLKSKGIEPKKISLGANEAKTAVATGACWYGINRNAVELSNIRTNASFGIQQRKGALKEDIVYRELLAAASPFSNGHKSGKKYLEHIIALKDKFSLDNNKVNFYQVMGRDAVKILSENQNHKFSKIAVVPVDIPTKAIQMRVYENDMVECAVQLETNEIKTIIGQVSDQEIADANDEHYTWIIQ